MLVTRWVQVSFVSELKMMLAGPGPPMQIHNGSSRPVHTVYSTWPCTDVHVDSTQEA